MDYVITRAKEDESDELMHYGVLGMKWGKRKAVPTSSTSSKVQSTKAQYKQDKKDYDKAYNKAYNKADAVEKDKTDYKQSKAERKINSAYRDTTKNSTTGEKLIYNDETRRKAAKYVVDQNMTIQDATAKADADAVRNIGVILATLGGITLASLYANSD